MISPKIPRKIFQEIARIVEMTRIMIIARIMVMARIMDIGVPLLMVLLIVSTPFASAQSAPGAVSGLPVSAPLAVKVVEEKFKDPAKGSVSVGTSPENVKVINEALVNANKIPSGVKIGAMPSSSFSAQPDGSIRITEEGLVLNFKKDGVEKGAITSIEVSRPIKSYAAQAADWVAASVEKLGVNIPKDIKETIKGLENAREVVISKKDGSSVTVSASSITISKDGAIEVARKSSKGAGQSTGQSIKIPSVSKGKIDVRELPPDAEASFFVSTTGDRGVHASVQSKENGASVVIQTDEHGGLSTSGSGYSLKTFSGRNEVLAKVGSDGKEGSASVFNDPKDSSTGILVKNGEVVRHQDGTEPFRAWGQEVSVSIDKNQQVFSASINKGTIEARPDLPLSSEHELMYMREPPSPKVLKDSVQLKQALSVAGWDPQNPAGRSVVLDESVIAIGGGGLIYQHQKDAFTKEIIKAESGSAGGFLLVAHDGDDRGVPIRVFDPSFLGNPAKKGEFLVNEEFLALDRKTGKILRMDDGQMPSHEWKVEHENGRVNVLIGDATMLSAAFIREKGAAFVAPNVKIGNILADDSMVLAEARSLDSEGGFSMTADALVSKAEKERAPLRQKQQAIADASRQAAEFIGKGDVGKAQQLFDNLQKQFPKDKDIDPAKAFASALVTGRIKGLIVAGKLDEASEIARSSKGSSQDKFMVAQALASHPDGKAMAGELLDALSSSSVSEIDKVGYRLARQRLGLSGQSTYNEVEKSAFTFAANEKGKVDKGVFDFSLTDFSRKVVDDRALGLFEKATKFSTADEKEYIASLLSRNTKDPQSDKILWQARVEDKVGNVKEAIADYNFIASHPDQYSHEAVDLSAKRLSALVPQEQVSTLISQGNLKSAEKVAASVSEGALKDRLIKYISDVKALNQGYESLARGSVSVAKTQLDAIKDPELQARLKSDIQKQEAYIEKTGDYLQRRFAAIALQREGLQESQKEGVQVSGNAAGLELNKAQLDQTKKEYASFLFKLTPAKLESEKNRLAPELMLLGQTSEISAQLEAINAAKRYFESGKSLDRFGSILAQENLEQSEYAGKWFKAIRWIQAPESSPGSVALQTDFFLKSQTDAFVAQAVGEASKSGNSPLSVLEKLKAQNDNLRFEAIFPEGKEREFYAQSLKGGLENTALLNAYARLNQISLHPELVGTRGLDVLESINANDLKAADLEKNAWSLDASHKSQALSEANQLRNQNRVLVEQNKFQVLANPVQTQSFITALNGEGKKLYLDAAVEQVNQLNTFSVANNLVDIVRSVGDWAGKGVEKGLFWGSQAVQSVAKKTLGENTVSNFISGGFDWSAESVGSIRSSLGFDMTKQVEERAKILVDAQAARDGFNLADSLSSRFQLRQDMSAAEVQHKITASLQAQGRIDAKVAASQYADKWAQTKQYLDKNSISTQPVYTKSDFFQQDGVLQRITNLEEGGKMLAATFAMGAVGAGWRMVAIAANALNAESKAIIAAGGAVSLGQKLVSIGGEVLNSGSKAVSFGKAAAEVGIGAAIFHDTDKVINALTTGASIRMADLLPSPKEIMDFALYRGTGLGVQGLAAKYGITSTAAQTAMSISGLAGTGAALEAIQQPPQTWQEAGELGLRHIASAVSMVGIGHAGESLGKGAMESIRQEQIARADRASISETTLWADKTIPSQVRSQVSDQIEARIKRGSSPDIQSFENARALLEKSGYVSSAPSTKQVVDYLSARQLSQDFIQSTIPPGVVEARAELNAGAKPGISAADVARAKEDEFLNAKLNIKARIDQHPEEVASEFKDWIKSQGGEISDEEISDSRASHAVKSLVSVNKADFYAQKLNDQWRLYNLYPLLSALESSKKKEELLVDPSYLNLKTQWMDAQLRVIESRQALGDLNLVPNIVSPVEFPAEAQPASIASDALFSQARQALASGRQDFVVQSLTAQKIQADIESSRLDRRLASVQSLPKVEGGKPQEVEAELKFRADAESTIKSERNAWKARSWELEQQRVDAALELNRLNREANAVSFTRDIGDNNLARFEAEEARLRIEQASLLENRLSIAKFQADAKLQDARLNGKIDAQQFEQARTSLSEKTSQTSEVLREQKNQAKSDALSAWKRIESQNRQSSLGQVASEFKPFEDFVDAEADVIKAQGVDLQKLDLQLQRKEQQLAYARRAVVQANNPGLERLIDDEVINALRSAEFKASATQEAAASLRDAVAGDLRAEAAILRDLQVKMVQQAISRDHPEVQNPGQIAEAAVPSVGAMESFNGKAEAVLALTASRARAEAAALRESILRANPLEEKDLGVADHIEKPLGARDAPEVPELISEVIPKKPGVVGVSLQRVINPESPIASVSPASPASPSIVGVPLETVANIPPSPPREGSPLSPIKGTLMDSEKTLAEAPIPIALSPLPKDQTAPGKTVKVDGDLNKEFNPGLPGALLDSLKDHIQMSSAGGVFFVTDQGLTSLKAGQPLQPADQFMEISITKADVLTGKVGFINGVVSDPALIQKMGSRVVEVQHTLASVADEFFNFVDTRRAVMLVPTDVGGVTKTVVKRIDPSEVSDFQNAYRDIRPALLSNKPLGQKDASRLADALSGTLSTKIELRPGEKAVPMGVYKSPFQSEGNARIFSEIFLSRSIESQEPTIIPAIPSGISQPIVTPPSPAPTAVQPVVSQLPSPSPLLSASPQHPSAPKQVAVESPRPESIVLSPIDQFNLDALSRDKGNDMGRSIMQEWLLTTKSPGTGEGLVRVRMDDNGKIAMNGKYELILTIKEDGRISKITPAEGDLRPPERMVQVLEQARAKANERYVELQIPSLINLLSENEDLNVAEGAMVALARIGEPAIPGLLKAIDSKEKAPLAIQALGAMKGVAVPYLVEFAKNSDPAIVSPAIEALGHVGPSADSAIPVLARHLFSGSNTIKISSARALARIGSENAARALLQGLGDSSAMVRKEVVEEIGSIGPKAGSAVSSLISLIDDPNWEVGAAAVKALGAIGPLAAPAVPAILQYASPFRPWALKFIDTIGPPAIPFLIQAAFNDPQPLFRQSAFDKLVQSGPQAIESLVLEFRQPHTFPIPNLDGLNEVKPGLETIVQELEGCPSCADLVHEYMVSVRPHWNVLPVDRLFLHLDSIVAKAGELSSLHGEERSRSIRLVLDDSDSAYDSFKRAVALNREVRDYRLYKPLLLEWSPKSLYTDVNAIAQELHIPAMELADSNNPSGPLKKRPLSSILEDIDKGLSTVPIVQSVKSFVFESGKVRLILPEKAEENLRNALMEIKGPSLPVQGRDAIRNRIRIVTEELPRSIELGRPTEALVVFLKESQSLSANEEIKLHNLLKEISSAKARELSKKEQEKLENAKKQLDGIKISKLLKLDEDTEVKPILEAILSHLDQDTVINDELIDLRKRYLGENDVSEQKPGGREIAKLITEDQRIRFLLMLGGNLDSAIDHYLFGLREHGFSDGEISVLRPALLKSRLFKAISELKPIVQSLQKEQGPIEKRNIRVLFDQKRLADIFH